MEKAIPHCISRQARSHDHPPRPQAVKANLHVFERLAINSIWPGSTDRDAGLRISVRPYWIHWHLRPTTRRLVLTTMEETLLGVAASLHVESRFETRLVSNTTGRSPNLGIALFPGQLPSSVAPRPDALVRPRRISQFQHPIWSKKA
jgi:hypothetical protein